MKTANTQQQKMLLSKHMGNRLISDAAFYRLRKNLNDIGIEPKDYQVVFPLIGEMNKNRSKIAYLSPSFLKTWEKFKTMTFIDKPMNCQQFQKYLEKQLPEEYRPKDRYIQGKLIGLSGTWYNWFRQAGIPYDKETEYGYDKYLVVAGLAFSWIYRKQEKARKTVVQTVQFENN